MSETILVPEHPQHIPVLFGPRDRHLKRLRHSLGAELVYRGDELKIRAPDDLIERSVDVVNRLLARIDSTGHLTDHDVSLTLGESPGESTIPEAGFADDPERTAGPSLFDEEDIETPSPGDFGDAINLFEKGRSIKPRSKGQAVYIDALRKNDLVFCAGPAGCGKTYLAVAMALHALRSGRIKKIVLVRPAVEAGEKIGFLPGDMLAKVNPFLRPLLDALGDLVGSDASKRYMEEDIVEVVPLAFMRGRTLNSTFMILDEAQNTTVTQMKMFLTRMGERSKIIVTGDTTQIDLPSDVRCGLTDAMDRLSNIRGVAKVRLGGADIVRHRLVRDIVRAYDESSAGNPGAGDSTSDANQSNSRDRSHTKSRPSSSRRRQARSS